MTRVTSGSSSHSRHRKIIKSAKGYFGREKILFEQLIKQWKKPANIPIEIGKRKRNFRSLWIRELMLPLN